VILTVDFDASPLGPGEVRQLVAFGSGALEVEIKCFVRTPPPAGFRGCSQCGTIRIRSGEAVDVAASPRVFRAASGAMIVTVTDKSDGDARVFQLEVRPLAEGLPDQPVASA